MTRHMGFILLFLMLAFAGDIAQAQTAGGDKCQVLFAVDTSRSMSRVSAMTRQTVFDLVYNGVQGQMNSGDLFGIWVFNEKVHTNVYTSLSWDALLNRGLATGAANFIKILPYEKNTKIDRLWAELVTYARQTKKLTVVIITDGTDRFVGTPFDTQINGFYDKHAREFRDAKKPFVITLAALDGKFLACTVNGARDTIAFDAIAAQVYEWKQGQPQNQAQIKPVVVSEVPTAPPVTQAPILPPPAVVIQTNAVVPKVIAEPVKTETVPPVAVIPTPAPVAVVPQPLTPVTPITAPVITTPPPPDVVAPVTAAPVVQTNVPIVKVVTPSSTKPVIEIPVEPSAPQNVSADAATNAIDLATEPAKVESIPPIRVEKTPVATPPVEQRSVEPAPKTTVAIVQPEPKPVPAPVSRPKENVVAPVTNRASAAVVKAPAGPTNKIGTNLMTSPGRPVIAPAPASKFGVRSPLVIIGTAIVLLVAAIGLLVVLLRRSRKKPLNSFISQSIDREFRP